MRNIKEIGFSEVPEKHIEKKSVTITESNGLNPDDFSDCGKTNEDKIRELERLKEKILSFDDCGKTNDHDRVEGCHIK